MHNFMLDYSIYRDYGTLPAVKFIVILFEYFSFVDLARPVMRTGREGAVRQGFICIASICIWLK